MSDDCCSTCGLPLVWSIDRARPWCSVYGDHPAYRPPPSAANSVAKLIHDLATLPCPAPSSTRSRERRARERLRSVS